MRRGGNFDITPSQSACVSMQDCCMVLQSHPDSLTRMVPTHVSARLCARIRDKIDGAPTAPSRSPGFPTCHRATLFSRNDSSLLFPLFSSSAHPPPAFLARPARHEAVFVFLPFVRIPAILLLSLLLRLFLLILLFLLATVLDAVQVQSERRDTTPTFPWRCLEAGSITDFGKSCIRRRVETEEPLLHRLTVVTFGS